MKEDQFLFSDHKNEIIRFVKKLSPRAEQTIAEEMSEYETQMTTMPERRRETIIRMSFTQYWNVLGKHKYPKLFETIKPIMEMIGSAACAERSWLTLRLIYSRLRNRQMNERIKKLLFVYSNYVLLDPDDKNDYILELAAALTENDFES